MSLSSGNKKYSELGQGHEEDASKDSSRSAPSVPDAERSPQGGRHRASL